MQQILIIDDDPQLRDMLRRALERAGYAVREARDGPAGRAAQAELPADLVICDVMMPGETGIETMEALIRAFPALKVIAISGGSLVADQFLAHALLFGAQRTFKKPFSLKELTAAVRELLGESVEPAAAAAP